MYESDLIEAWTILNQTASQTEPKPATQLGKYIALIGWLPLYNLMEFKFSAVLRSGSANGWLRLRNTGSPYTFTVCVMSLQLARHFLQSFRFCFALRVITDKSQTCIISISVQIPFLYFFTLWQSNEYSADLRIHCKKKFLELPVMYLIRHLLRYRKL